MTKVRNVGGKITETTKGNDNSFAKENITYNSQKKISFTSDKGIKHGKPETLPPPELPSKCKVEFRPSKSWQGEFGFDWCRIGDSQLPVDKPYSDIVGKYGAIYATSPSAVFTIKPELYQRHLAEYEKFVLSAFGTYYVPNLSLMKGEIAVLDAAIEIKEKPDSMYYKYDKTVFEVKILEKLSNTKGKHFNDKVLEIKCLKEFSSKQKIELIATKNKIDNKIGQINVLPNNKVKEIDILFIPVEHNGSSGTIKGKEITILTNALKQAYVKGNIVRHKEKIKVGGWWYDLFFTKKDDKGVVSMETSNIRSIHRALDDVFFKEKDNEIYKNHYRVYMLTNSTSLNGMAEGIGKNAKVVVVYNNRNDSTAPHELMHAMGLYHTFDNDGLFTYKFQNTDNIMDYTHQVGKDRFSTNTWQWKILN